MLPISHSSRFIMEDSQSGVEHLMVGTTKKPVTMKPETKKAVPTKVEPKKVELKKPVPKKAEPKKAVIGKTAAKPVSKPKK